MTTPTDQTTELPPETPADQAPAQPHAPAGFFSAPRRYAAMLPDGRFFARIVPVEPDAHPASVVEQVELALETFSPFPISKLYYGHYWQPGSPRALVFASYRKRFLPEEMQYWHDDEIVTPSFAVLLAVPAAAGTVRVLVSPDAVTVLHWEDDSGVPTQAVIQPIAGDATASERASSRDRLLNELGIKVAYEEWDQPVLQGMSDNGDLTFVAAENEIKIHAGLAGALDVRDKDELAERNRLHHRDILLWRLLLGAGVLLVLFAAGEVALSVGNKRLTASQAKYEENQPIVKEVQNTAAVADQIDQVVRRRLLPLEMLELVRQKKPENTSLTATNFTMTKDGTFNLQATGRTTSAAEVQEFQDKLLTVEQFSTVEALISNTGGGGSGFGGTPAINFSLTITLKPGAILPESEQPTPPPALEGVTTPSLPTSSPRSGATAAPTASGG